MENKRIELQWQEIDNYEGFYEVSSTGLIKSLHRTISLSTGKKRTVNSRILKQKDNGSGYKFVVLSKGNVQKSYYVHRLVASAFVSNDTNQDCVNHIDGNPSNNHYLNLEWVSHSDNVKHAYNSDLNAHKGAKHTFSVGVVDNEIGAEFGSIKEWAEVREINYSTARNILNGYNITDDINIELIGKINREDMYEKTGDTN